MTFLMKIMILGDKGVGKTTFRSRFVGRSFQTKFRPTSQMKVIGAEWELKEHQISDRLLKFQIWETAGQQRFGAVRSVYYLGCLGALLLFDVTRRESFQNLQHWLKEIWNNNGKGVIPIVVIGNKSDLRDQFPESISIDTAQKYCAKISEQTKPHGFEVQYFEASAKTNLNVTEAFELLGQHYFEYLDKQKRK